MTTAEPTTPAPRRAQIQALAAGAPSLLAAAEVCQTQGFSMAEGAPVLYTAFSGTTATEMAVVLAAVWPGTATLQDLSAALKSCEKGDGTPAFSDADVAAAAKTSSTQYYDLFMRDGLGDTGTIPYPSSVASASPDIIPYGYDPAGQPPDPSAFFSANYGQDVGKNVYERPRVNFIYPRVTNLYPGQASGEVSLYWSLASLLLRPSQWVGNRIGNANGKQSAPLANVPSGGVAVGTPFLWETDPAAADDHFCLIGQVTTHRNPNTIPTTDKLVDFTQWVRDHPAIAWRNIATVPSTGGPTQMNLLFGNPDSTTEWFRVAADCKAVPSGSTVSLVCPVAGPHPAIDTTATITTDDQSVTVFTQLPAGFSGRLVVTVTPPSGVVLASDATVNVTFKVSVPPEHPLAAFAEPAERLGLAEDAPVHAGGQGRLVFLGNFVLVLSPG